METSLGVQDKWREKSGKSKTFIFLVPSHFAKKDWHQ